MILKNLKTYLALTIAILTVFVIVIIGINTSSANDEDVEAIKHILIKSQTIADRAYVDAKKLQKADVIEEQTQKTASIEEQQEKKAKKDSLIKAYTNEFNNIFSPETKTMKKVWIDDQFTNSIDGPDCIDCGVSNIKIKDISISDSTATVTAVLTKYLIDRVNQDGKLYHDKMEGEVLVKATLKKTDNNWLIDEYSADPEYGEVNHTLTEEKCNSAPKNASNDLVITQNDEKAILEYLDTKTDDIAHPSEGKMYSAYKILGTDSNKIYLWLFKQEYIKKKEQTALEKGNTVLSPVVLTIKNNDKGFSIISHECPRDGVDYGKDVGKLFPSNIDIPYNDREEILKLEKSADYRAEEYFR